MVYPLRYSYLEYSLDNVENFKDLVKPIEEYKNHPSFHFLNIITVYIFCVFSPRFLFFMYRCIQD